MRYALRKQKQIAAELGVTYLNEHILASLKIYFESHTEDEITEEIENTAFVPEWLQYPMFRINDVADSNSMLEFAVIGQHYDVLHLSFLGRMKGLTSKQSIEMTVIIIVSLILFSIFALLVVCGGNDMQHTLCCQTAKRLQNKGEELPDFLKKYL